MVGCQLNMLYKLKLVPRRFSIYSLHDDLHDVKNFGYYKEMLCYSGVHIVMIGSIAALKHEKKRVEISTQAYLCSYTMYYRNICTKRARDNRNRAHRALKGIDLTVEALNLPPELVGLLLGLSHAISIALG